MNGMARFHTIAIAAMEQLLAGKLATKDRVRLTADLAAAKMLLAKVTKVAA